MSTNNIEAGAGKSFFTERLVRKESDKKELALSLLIAVLAALLCALAFLFLKTAAIIIWAAVIYGAYYLISGLLFKEYEYILTDSTLDIDLVTAKRSRKRLKSINVKELNGGGKFDGKKPGEFLCPSVKSENLYYLEGKNETLIIDPNDMMIRAFEYYMGTRFKR